MSYGHQSAFLTYTELVLQHKNKVFSEFQVSEEVTWTFGMSTPSFLSHEKTGQYRTPFTGLGEYLTRSVLSKNKVGVKIVSLGVDAACQISIRTAIPYLVDICSRRPIVLDSWAFPNIELDD